MLTEEAFRDGSLCVVGNINRDVKAFDVPAGEGLCRDGETSVSSILETVGGGGANSACAAATLGARVGFMGKVGADALGERLKRTLEHLRIRTWLARDVQNPSGSSIALSYDTSQRHFLSWLPASRSLSLADLELSALEGHQHLLRADVWFSESMLFEGNKVLFQKAQSLGIQVSLDLNWDPHWGRESAQRVRRRKQAVRDVLPWVNLAHGNVRELTEFTEESDLESALKRLTDWGVEGVVVHLGDKGAGYYQRDLLMIEPAAAVSSRVSMTGSGDVLSVCFMLLYARKDVPIRERLRLANGVVGRFIEGRLSLIPSLLQ